MSKRFELIDDYSISYDGDYFDLHKPSDIRSLVTVIGYVTDENEQLKKNNQELYDKLQTTMSYESLKRGENTILKKENEELTEAYLKLKERHSLLHDNCIELECDRDMYHNDVLSLEKENRELKEKVEDLRFKLRTIKAYDKTINEEPYYTVQEFKHELEKWG